MALTKVSYSMITGAVQNVIDFGADPTGVNDSTIAIQTALDAKGAVYLPTGTYKITSSLVIYGNTEVFGDGPGLSIIRGSGFSSTALIKDSSQVTSTDVNLNIVLRDFELDCNSYALGTSSGIIFYRVGNLYVDNIYVHDCGASLFNWGTSYVDTVNVNVLNSRFVRARAGDAVQGAGRNVVIQNCYVFSAGDTAYAILRDFNATTNPSTLFANNVTFDNCTAVGDWVNGSFTGAGNATQLGFGFGPYNTNAELYITVTNCTCKNLYANVWAVVFNKFKLTGNMFHAASVLDTGGVRLDGVMDVIISNNTFESSFVGTTLDYQALLLQAGRFVYGASTFDTDIRRVIIDGNAFKGNATPQVQFNVNPAYAVVADVSISGNIFTNCTLPIQFRPSSGSGSGIISRVTIAANTTDATITSFVTMSGVNFQYVNFQLLENNIGNEALFSGTGASASYVNGAYKAFFPAVADGVATTIYTMSNLYNSVEITANCPTGTSAYIAIAKIIDNGGGPRIAWQSNGANCTITLVGNDVKVTQTGAGAQNVFVTVSYQS